MLFVTVYKNDPCWHGSEWALCITSSSITYVLYFKQRKCISQQGFLEGFLLTACLKKVATREGITHSAKLLRKLLKASWLLLWTWLHIVCARLLVPLVNGMRSDPSFRTYWVLIAVWGRLGAGEASYNKFSEITGSLCPALPASYPHTPASLVFSSLHQSTISRDVLAPFSLLQQQALPLLLAELCLIILSGLLRILINS